MTTPTASSPLTHSDDPMESIRAEFETALRAVLPLEWKITPRGDATSFQFECECDGFVRRTPCGDLIRTARPPLELWVRSIVVEAQRQICLPLRLFQ